MSDFVNMSDNPDTFFRRGCRHLRRTRQPRAAAAALALTDGPRTAGDLADHIDLSRPAVSEHLQVLRKANLVRDQPSGRERYYHLNAAPMAEVAAWLRPFERYWRGRLDALSALLDEETS